MPLWGHTAVVSTDVRATYESAARCFVDLVDNIPATAWDGPGLGEWDLRSLVGHTGRALGTVIAYLQRPTTDDHVGTAAAYYDLAIGQVDPAAIADRGRQAGLALGPEPAFAVHALLDEALAALAAVNGDPVIETIAGGMRLDAYLSTRNFELTVHTLDIAAACDVQVAVPATALRDALLLAGDVALRRGDGPAILLALTGRQALPAHYSMV
jgi:Mycothiol maleylpyruvate isomerase N-terminal domain